MDRQTLLQMFTAAMRHGLQHGAAEHGPETWQALTADKCIFHLSQAVERLTLNPRLPLGIELRALVNIANYAAFAWAHLQGLPGREDIQAVPPAATVAAPAPVTETTELSLREVQRRMAEFSVGNRLASTPELMALGVMEELGEFSHALLKHRQGIRGYDDLEKFYIDAIDAIGDCLIYLTQLAESLGFDLQSIVNDVVPRVLKRDWLAHPEDADQVAAAAATPEA